MVVVFLSVSLQLPNHWQSHRVHTYARAPSDFHCWRDRWYGKSVHGGYGWSLDTCNLFWALVQFRYCGGGGYWCEGLLVVELGSSPRKPDQFSVSKCLCYFLLWYDEILSLRMISCTISNLSDKRTVMSWALSHGPKPFFSGTYCGRVQDITQGPHHIVWWKRSSRWRPGVVHCCVPRALNNLSCLCVFLPTKCHCCMLVDW